MAICPQCGGSGKLESRHSGSVICSPCGGTGTVDNAQAVSAALTPQAIAAPQSIDERRYKLAHSIAESQEGFGRIVKWIGILLALLGFSAGAAGRLWGWGLLLCGLGVAVTGLTMMFMAQLLLVFIDTEDNTRKVSQSMQRIEGALLAKLKN